MPRIIVTTLLFALALAGAVLAGVGLPACVGTGRAAAADVLAHLGRAPRPPSVTAARTTRHPNAR